MSVALIQISGVISPDAPPSNPPVAFWEVSDQQPFVGETINFTDLSTNNPTSWSWYINDVPYSNDQNPSYYPTTAGAVLFFKLTATNAFGSSDYTSAIQVQFS